MRRFLTPTAILTVVLLIAGCSSSETADSTASAEPPSSTAGAPLTIMTIGDSITQGAIGRTNYQCYLDAMLTDAGVSFDFVGTQSEPHSGGVYDCPTSFDQDHEAYSMLDIGRAKNQVTPTVADLQPDIALVHLGHVNLYPRYDADPVYGASLLESFITGLQAANPDITVLVAQIIPCDPNRASRPVLPDRCDDPEVGPVFNQAVAEFDRLSTDTSRVIVVDMQTGFGLDMLRDGAHPTEAGDEFIATRWMKAIEDAGLI